MIRRVFLNRPTHHSLAMIYAQVSKTDDVLKIADCDRTVTLSIDSYDRDDRDNTLYKIDTMLAVLTQFRAALGEKFAKLDNKK